MKPVLESPLELSQSTKINTFNKQKQSCTKYKTFQLYRKIEEDERVWEENVSKRMYESEQSRFMTMGL